MFFCFYELPRTHARLHDPVVRISEATRDAENHFPLDRQIGVGLDDSLDRFAKLALRVHGTYTRTNSQIDIKMTSRRNECRFMSPTRLNRIDRTLRRHQPGSVFLCVLRKPFFQQGDDLGGVDDGVFPFDDMANTGVVQISTHDDFKPAESDFFPRHRPAGFGDDRKIAAHTLL